MAVDRNQPIGGKRRAAGREDHVGGRVQAVLVVAHIHEGAGDARRANVESWRVLVVVTEVLDLQAGQNICKQVGCLRG